MPDMSGIQASADVQAVFGQDLLQLAGGRYECWRCGQAGDMSTPTSAIAVLSDNYPSLQWAHARCVPSVVVRMRGRIIIGAEADAEDSMLRVRAAVLNRGPDRREWPVLLHEFEPSPWRPSGSEGLPDPDARRLAEDGLTLVTRTHGLADLDVARGWRLELRGSRARLVAPDGSVYYTGRWVAPAGWEELASGRGCLLLSGTVGLHRRGAMTMPEGKLARLVDRAVRGGSVAGGIVTVARA
jgi:hypothetical protein